MSIKCSAKKPPMPSSVLSSSAISATPRTATSTSFACSEMHCTTSAHQDSTLTTSYGCATGRGTSEVATLPLVSKFKHIAIFSLESNCTWKKIVLVNDNWQDESGSTCQCTCVIWLHFEIWFIGNFDLSTNILFSSKGVCINFLTMYYDHLEINHSKCFVLKKKYIFYSHPVTCKVK